MPQLADDDQRMVTLPQYLRAGSLTVDSCDLHSRTRFGMTDVAEFLKAHEPFESFTAGSIIFKQGQPPPSEIRVIRRGTVELVDEGRVLDVLEDGEMFGQAWMFSGLPTGCEARACEDTLCYAFATADVVPLLRGPAGLRFVARSLLMSPRPGDPDAFEAGVTDSAQQSAMALIGEQPAICGPSVPLREAARGMVEHGASSVLVRLENGELGIPDRP